MGLETFSFVTHTTVMKQIWR